jgi:transposase
MVEDLRLLLREFTGRKSQPTAMLLDSRTIQSTPESGARAGYDGAKRRKSSKVHAAVDTLGHLLALSVTPADEQDRAQVGGLASQVQLITGDHVELAYVDEGYTGQATGEAAAEHGIRLEVVKHTEAKRGFPHPTRTHRLALSDRAYSYKKAPQIRLSPSAVLTRHDKSLRESGRLHEGCWTCRRCFGQRRGYNLSIPVRLRSEDC